MVSPVYFSFLRPCGMSHSESALMSRLAAAESPNVPHIGRWQLTKAVATI